MWIHDFLANFTAQLIKSEIDSTFSESLSHGKYFIGLKFRSLEEKLSSMGCLNIYNFVAILVRCFQIAPDALPFPCIDEVYVPAFTYLATAETIQIAVLTPIL